MIKRVFIPLKEEHEGIEGIWVNLTWECPVCHQPRGKIFQTFSWDGSRKLYCDGWENPCGHIDKYSAIRNEAEKNKLNESYITPEKIKIRHKRLPR